MFPKQWIPEVALNAYCDNCESYFVKQRDGKWRVGFDDMEAMLDTFDIRNLFYVLEIE
jgi:hypothetical protein